MASNLNPFDVFIAYDHPDREHANQIARVLESYGLTVFLDQRSSAADAEAEGMIWEAMAESQALVLVVSETKPSSRVIFEIGAAKAWVKPIYGIVVSATMCRVPPSLHDIPTVPISRIDEIAEAIRANGDSITEEDQQSLSSLYKRLNISVDQLAMRPRDLSRLVKDFHKQSGKQLSGEQVMRLLLRMRKRRALPALTRPVSRPMA